MTKLLLDHPWPLDATLNRASPAYNKLLEFHKLIRRLMVAAVPFITQQERDETVARLDYRQNAAAAAAIRRFADELVYRGNNVQQAVIEQGPVGLSATWLCSLWDEFHSCNTWRLPQIVFPEVRRAEWGTNPTPLEVEVQCGSKTDESVLVMLEIYDSHRFALCDIDPWKHNNWLRCPSPGDTHPHPCWLPRPPALQSVPLEKIPNFLDAAGRQGWQIGNRHYYIPPMDYSPLTISKHDWRSGKAFPHRGTKSSNGSGYKDLDGRIWVWARAPAGARGERHWDVELEPGWCNVSHDGGEV